MRSRLEYGVTSRFVLCFALVPLLSGAFTFRRTPGKTYIVCRSTFEYEYLPPNPGARPDETALASAYPDGTPSGLRGEAVRSALLSSRCIGWELTNDEHMSVGGVLQIKGKGMRDFLNNKLTQDFSSPSVTYQEACLLDAKGRVVDRLKVSIVDDQTALIMTSPGHSSRELLKRLDPFIFPMDQIEMTNFDASFSFSLASTQWSDVVKAMTDQAFPNNGKTSFDFPSREDQCQQWSWDSDDVKVLVMPTTGMPSQICAGFTFVFHGSDAAQTTGQKVWEYLISEANAEGPIAIGALEYESLRVEAGVPAFDHEIGAKTSPLELHWQEMINMDKGCYLGQEGVASMIKNRRGPPRLLYSVVFEDDLNTYETESRGDNSNVENLTNQPKPGDKLFALGSNEELSVGSLTSVAEAGGTGAPCTVALALVRRADSIMKRMKELDLEIFRDTDDFIDVDAASGMIEPPPLDPLDGLEVIVGGTFTVGKLKMIPSRGLRKGKSIFDDTLAVEEFFDTSDHYVSSEHTQNLEPIDDSELVNMEVEMEKAAAEAEFASAEAKRKAGKLALLKKKAEEAMARRKQKNQPPQ